MRKRYLFLLFFSCCTSLLVFAQDSGKQKAPVIFLKPTGDFDQRFSFLDNQPVSIWGYRIGALVNDRFKVGIGGYYIDHDYKGSSQTKNSSFDFEQERKIAFGTIYFEPYLIRKKCWESSLVFELGYGNITLDSSINNGETKTLTRERQHFMPAGVGLSFNFIIPEKKGMHFLTYFGINTMIGLRKAVFVSNSAYNYDGWYWSIGSAIFIDKMYSDLKNHKKNKTVLKNN